MAGSVVNDRSPRLRPVQSAIGFHCVSTVDPSHVAGQFPLPRLALSAACRAAGLLYGSRGSWEEGKAEGLVGPGDLGCGAYRSHSLLGSPALSPSHVHVFPVIPGPIRRRRLTDLPGYSCTLSSRLAFSATPTHANICYGTAYLRLGGLYTSIVDANLPSASLSLLFDPLP